MWQGWGYLIILQHPQLSAPELFMTGEDARVQHVHVHARSCACLYVFGMLRGAFPARGS